MKFNSKFRAAILVLSLSACSASPALPGATMSAAPSQSATASAHASKTPPPTPSPTPEAASGDLGVNALPQLDDLIRGDDIASLAGGSAGFVMLGSDRRTGALMSWTSTDGGGWSRHRLPGSTFGGGTPDMLVGGSFGYLALGWRQADPSSSRALWFSPDGVEWSPAAAKGLPAGRITSIVSGPSGAALAIDQGKRGGAIATTQDGRTWQIADLRGGPVPRKPTILALPSGFFAFGADPLQSDDNTELTATAWRTDNGSTWMKDRLFADEFEGFDTVIDGWQLSPRGAAGFDHFEENVHVFNAVGVETFATPEESSGGTLVGAANRLLWIEGGNASASCFAAWRLVGRAWVTLTGANVDRQCMYTAFPMVQAAASTADATVIIGSNESVPDSLAWLVRAP
jgi:hypothetical protein